jgi:hypothetical protein
MTTLKDKGKGGLTAYIPTHDDEAVMDGAPDRFGLEKENRQRPEQRQGSSLRLG